MGFHSRREASTKRHGSLGCLWGSAKDMGSMGGHKCWSGKNQGLLPRNLTGSFQVSHQRSSSFYQKSKKVVKDFNYNKLSI